MERLEQYVRAEIASGISVEDMARESRMKPSRFNESFKKQTGETPYGFVKRVRLQMAIDLLLAGTEPLATIASSLGFADQAHFSREVKAQTGHSPSEYRS